MLSQKTLFHHSNSFINPVSVGADVCDVCVSAGPEEDDVQVDDESYHQHAKPLPLPVCQSPAGMDGFPLQHALLHRFYGTGNDFSVSACKSHICFANVTNECSRFQLNCSDWGRCLADITSNFHNDFCFDY